MKFYLLTAAAAAAAVVAATAPADSYVSSSAPLPSGVFSSPYFLWAAANVIFLWLVLSYRGHTAAAGDGAGEIGGDMDNMGYYTSSEQDDVFAVGAVAADLVVAAAPVVATVAKKKQPREARAAKRSTDSKRVSKASTGRETPVRAVAVEAKPEVVVKKPILVEEEWLTWNLAATDKPNIRKSVVEEEWPEWSSFVEEANPVDAQKPLVDEEEWSALALACTAEPKPAVEKPVVVEEPWPSNWAIAAPEVKMAIKKPVAVEVEDPWPSTWTIAAPLADVKKSGEERAITLTTTDSKPKPDDDGDDDVSMDSMWETILQSGRARPVTVRKSETWATDDQPRRERAAESAVTRREIRKSATATNMTPLPSPPHVRAPPPPAKQPWRTREVLPAMQNDELMRRAESLIRRHHEQLRLQRQESEQRQVLELQRRRPLIRV